MARPSLGLGLGEWSRLEEGHPLGHTALCRANSLVFCLFVCLFSLLRIVRF